MSKRSFWTLKVRPKMLLTILACTLAFYGSFSIFKPCIIEGFSMYPWVQTGDWIIVNKLDHTPERGQVITLSIPNYKYRLLKRVIGMPGDEIVIIDGMAYVNNHVVPDLNRHVLFSGRGATKEYTVPKGHIFVLGDNRANSSDSREFGYVSLEDVEGVVLGRIWR